MPLSERVGPAARRVAATALLIGAPLALALPLALSAPTATAGIFDFARKKVEEPDPAPQVDTDAPPVDKRPKVAPTPLWTPLPTKLGPLPEGLANVSAQGCAACHPAEVDAWRTSGHAHGPSDTLRAAADAAADPRCMSCHLPLDVQHRQHVVLDGGDPKTPVRGPNADFDATLATEGVTCAACHLRKGKVLGDSPHPAVAPHAPGFARELTDARACAPCHQLTWPGADRPIYDTVGEWERSAYPAAGITCQTCHLDSSAGHGMALPAARAVSVLVTLAPDPLVRGGDAVKGRITVQNTGAGHSFPTGSPWQGVRLKAEVLGPDGDDAQKVWATPVAVEFMHFLQAEPPWMTKADTRIPAGSQRASSLEVKLPVDAPRGPWFLVTSLVATKLTNDGGIEEVGEPLLVQKLPLLVE